MKGISQSQKRMALTDMYKGCQCQQRRHDLFLLALNMDEKMWIDKQNIFRIGGGVWQNEGADMLTIDKVLVAGIVLSDGICYSFEASRTWHKILCYPRLVLSQNDVNKK